MNLSHALEALLSTSPEPLHWPDFRRLLPDASRETLQQALSELEQRLSHSALMLQSSHSGFRLVVRPEYSAVVQGLYAEKPPKLSRATLETLAVIAYRQPVTRADIENIRGVTVSAPLLKSLLDRGWIEECGVRETVGRPTLFATTRQYLDDLGLKSLDDLPALPDWKDPHAHH
jgi:segregation and condensation protein B